MELYDRTRAQGVRFQWLTFDEWYGGQRPFLRALNARQQKFVAEIPKDFRAWLDRPRVVRHPFSRGRRARAPTVARLAAGSRPTQTVQQLAQMHRALAAQAWQTWRIRHTHKGPLVWHVKQVLIYLPDQGGPQTSAGGAEGPYHLVVCTHPLSGEVKYFLSNAPANAPWKMLLHGAFDRWRIERCFEDGKGEVVLDHWEGRRWLGLKRHLILTSVSYLFLARTYHRPRKKNPDWTVCQMRMVADVFVLGWLLPEETRADLFAETACHIEYYQQRNAAARASHMRSTMAKLHRQGITLSTLPRCDQDTS